MNIVFDFGAVLFDWQPARLVARQFPALAATPVQARELTEAIFQHPDWHHFDCGRIGLNDVVALTAERLALPAADVMELVGPIGEELKPIDGNVALLEGLRVLRDGDQGQGDQGEGVLRLFFLSNMPAPYARTLEQRHAFLQWFDGGIFSGDVQLGKPDPAIFSLLASRYGLDPSATLFIDDAHANVVAAQNLGWHGLHCPQPGGLPEQLASRFNPETAVGRLFARTCP